MDECVREWNETLRGRLLSFAEESKQATVLLFSVHALLGKMLDTPEDFDFGADDTTTLGGAIWRDDIHLTSAVHAIVAQKFLQGLGRVQISQDAE